jgi:hypothetical protein
MSDFMLWLSLGWQHILDIQGYDHMMFLLATFCGFSFRDLKKVIFAVSFFTIGHSLSLAYSAISGPVLPSKIVEIGIAVTIFFAGIQWWLSLQTRRFSWLIIFGIGLIHGLGFSTYLRSLFGHETSIIQPLFSFNLGLELGQLVFVGAILGLISLLKKTSLLDSPQKHLQFSQIIGSLCALWSLWLIFNRL